MKFATISDDKFAEITINVIREDFKDMTKDHPELFLLLMMFSARLSTEIFNEKKSELEERKAEKDEPKGDS